MSDLSDLNKIAAEIAGNRLFPIQLPANVSEFSVTWTPGHITVAVVRRGMPLAAGYPVPPNWAFPAEPEPPEGLWTLTSRLP